MKQFFVTVLAVLTGIWASVLIGGLLLLVIIGVAAAAGISSGKSGEVKKHSVLYICLEGEVTDRESMPSLMDQLSSSSLTTMPLNELVAALENAATDKDIDGIYIKGNGVSAGLAQAQAIIRAIEKFKESGKWVYTYSDNYSQTDYFVSSVADSMFVNPVGMIDIHGLASQKMYFKGLLDKLDVEVQVVKVGTFKSAVEPFILKEGSEADRLQTETFLGNIWKDMLSTMARGRGVSEETINGWANDYLFSKDATYYVENKVVDGALYEHEMTKKLAELTDQDKDPELIDVQEYVTARQLMSKNEGKGKQIAVLYAVGDITTSDKEGIASERLVPQIIDLADDDDVDGLIMRVNSPGGSAYASNQIWEALEYFKKKTGKPFYVSMGDYAASGGYYISSGADRIYAEPLTLTGSIGIFGMIPNVNGLLKNKLGVNVNLVSTNHGAMPNILQPMTPQQRASMQSYVDRGYEEFVGICSQGRHMSVDSIKAIAEGRVWDGISALQIGLVDRLGGLDMAIVDMASQLGVADGDYYVSEYPETKAKWWEMLVKASKDLETSYVKKHLGAAAPYYEAIESMHDLDPLQCRMETFVIQ